jgi:hypothetical protein
MGSGTLLVGVPEPLGSQLSHTGRGLLYALGDSGAQRVTTRAS